MPRLYLDGSGVIHSPKEIGWTGREGLFFIPDLVENVSHADFYKFYAAGTPEMVELLLTCWSCEQIA